ncbi:hypothetical protein FG386_002730 [Cryptosporidium ryanae]|uniref:uncharacterized protein n=1 Tax=Cryptosporidium ryanae TaxID=515981 RepID=UPI00351AA9F9|nr:hypothetical protein FG386_002730 [Cryptosporidium ryanae]
MEEKYWEEVGSFSLFLGNVPHNILLSSEEMGRDEDDRGSLSDFGEGRGGRGGGRGGCLGVRRGKYGVRDLLPTNSYVRDYFNVTRGKCGVGNGGSGVVGAESSGPFGLESTPPGSGSGLVSGTKGSGECLRSAGLTRNDLEERLASKIQELRRRKSRASIKGTDGKRLDDAQGQDEFEFGRVKTSGGNSGGGFSPDKRESKMKRINRALLEIKREEEMLRNLPQEEREIRIREIAVSKAMKKAQGIKVKDNRARLLKSKKQIEAKKRKSKKRWDEIKRRNKQ